MWVRSMYLSKGDPLFHSFSRLHIAVITAGAVCSRPNWSRNVANDFPNVSIVPESQHYHTWCAVSTNLHPGHLPIGLNFHLLVIFPTEHHPEECLVNQHVTLIRSEERRVTCY